MQQNRDCGATDLTFQIHIFRKLVEFTLKSYGLFDSIIQLGISNFLDNFHQV